MNIPDLITILRNATLAKKPKITIKTSKKTLKFLDVLVENKYILDYSQNKNGKVQIFLDFTHKSNKIVSFHHISKPSKRIYFSCKDLWKFRRSLGLIVLNTSKGMISHKTALSQNLGGEALSYML